MPFSTAAHLLSIRLVSVFNWFKLFITLSIFPFIVFNSFITSPGLGWSSFIIARFPSEAESFVWRVMGLVLLVLDDMTDSNSCGLWLVTTYKLLS